MSIAKCKKCGEVIMTTEHLEDKKILYAQVASWGNSK